MKRLSAVAFCLLTLTLFGSAKPASKKSIAPSAPDKAHLQKIWDGWNTLDAANQAKFYAEGQHTFFDVEPLKYNSWAEYSQGVKGLADAYKSARFTVNDDLAIHPHGDLVWATSTIAYELTTKAGKVNMGNFRWTAIFENQGGQWLIVHEHVSAPMQ